MNARRLIFGLSCLLFLSGCATQNSYLNRFSAYAPAMSNVCCLIDATVLEDVAGSVDEFNISNNTVLAQCIFSSITNSLASKGYSFAQPPVISVGGRISGNGIRAVGADPDRAGAVLFANISGFNVRIAGVKPSASGEFLPPPYVVSGGGGSRPQDLRFVYDALGYVRQGANADMLPIPAREALQTFVSNSVIIVTIHGRSFSILEDMGKKVGLGMLTLGLLVPRAEPPIKPEFLYIVDVASGEMVWGDVQMITGGQLTAETLSNNTRRLVGRIPGRSPP